jgi:hypothetical protein
MIVDSALILLDHRHHGGEVAVVLGGCGERVSDGSNSLISGKLQGISLKTPPPLALNPLNSEFVWTNSLHIEQGIFGRKQRSLLRELRKFYSESADVA